MKVAGQVILGNIFLVLTLFSGHYASAGDLIWSIDCKPGDDTCNANIGYPDIEGDGVAFNCGSPGYTGHHGTDISLTSSANLEDGVSVLAAADGVVEWVFDGKYDQCPDATNFDCQAPPNGWFEPGQSNGYRVCTDAGNYCNTGDCCCYWCFDGGNVVVRHTGVEGVFATRYDHLKVNSILVSPGETVNAGQKIAEVGSAGNSTGPLMFQFEYLNKQKMPGGLPQFEDVFGKFVEQLPAGFDYCLEIRTLSDASYTIAI